MSNKKDIWFEVIIKEKDKSLKEGVSFLLPKEDFLNPKVMKIYIDKALIALAILNTGYFKH